MLLCREDGIISRCAAEAACLWQAHPGCSTHKCAAVLAESQLLLCLALPACLCCFLVDPWPQPVLPQPALLAAAAATAVTGAHCCCCCAAAPPSARCQTAGRCCPCASAACLRWRLAAPTCNQQHAAVTDASLVSCRRKFHPQTDNQYDHTASNYPCLPRHVTSGGQQSPIPQTLLPLRSALGPTVSHRFGYVEVSLCFP